MKIEQIAVLSADEIVNVLKYRAVAGLSHGTGYYKPQVQAVLAEKFDEKQQKEVEVIRRTTENWLNNGHPSSYRCPYERYKVWKKFIKFLTAYCTSYGKGDADFVGKYYN